MEQVRRWIAILLIAILVLNIIGGIVFRYSQFIFWGIIAVAGLISYMFYRKKQ